MLFAPSVIFICNELPWPVKYRWRQEIQHIEQVFIDNQTKCSSQQRQMWVRCTQWWKHGISGKKFYVQRMAGSFAIAFMNEGTLLHNSLIRQDIPTVCCSGKERFLKSSCPAWKFSHLLAMVRTVLFVGSWVRYICLYLSLAYREESDWIVRTMLCDSVIT